jgi:hypothetical protein
MTLLLIFLHLERAWSEGCKIGLKLELEELGLKLKLELEELELELDEFEKRLRPELEI